MIRSPLPYSGCLLNQNTLMSDFRNHLGVLLQLAGLTFLPVLMIWQLNYGFNLLWMPSMTLLGVVVFALGHWLRDKNS